MGLGCMSMSYAGREEEESVRTLVEFLDAGQNLVDTADRYGDDGHNENLVGRALRGRRDVAVLATKVGLVGRAEGDRQVDGRPEHIRAAVRASLVRLGTDHIDLYYLHRVDPEVPVEESIGAMAELVGAGLVRQIGVSEVSSQTLRRAHAVHPIAALQSEYSLWSREPEEDILDTCADLGTTFVAYTPLGKGFLTGAFRRPEDVGAAGRAPSTPRLEPGNFEKNLHLVDALARVAGRVGCTPAQLGLAWLLEQGVVPLPGTARRTHLRENLGALEFRLDADTVAEIDRLMPVGVAAGERRSPARLKLTGG